MTRELAPIDVSTMPVVARLAEEVAHTGRPRVLRQDGTDLAVILPAHRHGGRTGKAVTEADIADALSASWVGLIDPEQLKRELDEARSDDQPPVQP